MPDKSPDAFRTISEVAEWLGVQPHVLRFWESKFSQVRPVKRAGGRRYYRPNDMLLLGGIRKLLHEDGLTIKGAQKVLREEGMTHVARMSQPLDPESAALSQLVEDEAAGNDAEPVAEETRQVVSLGAARAHGDPERKTSDVAASDALPDASADHELPETVSESEAPLDEHTDVAEADDTEHAGESDTDMPATSALPSFRHNPSPRQPATVPPDEVPANTTADAGASDGLPSFLTAPSAPGEDAPEGDDPAAQRTEAPSDAANVEDAPQSDTEALRPRIVDAPDPDDSSFEVRPGALSAAFAVTRLTPARSADLMPLIAQLAALRDRMAAEHGQ